MNINRITTIKNILKQIPGVIKSVLKKEMKVIKIEDTSEIEYLYHITPTKNISNIDMDGYIKLTKASSEPLLYKVKTENEYALFCFRKIPLKSQLEITKGIILEKMSMIAIKYDENKMKDIHTRTLDDAVILFWADTKLNLKDSSYKIDNLDW